MMMILPPKGCLEVRVHSTPNWSKHRKLTRAGVHLQLLQIIIGYICHRVPGGAQFANMSFLGFEIDITG